MAYLILFLEGVITFISPCLLPMLPIYISYFAGSTKTSERSKWITFKNAIGFVLGFTIIFIILGALAGTVGSYFKEHSRLINITSGVVVILFGLNFMGIMKLFWINQNRQSNIKLININFFTSLLFGIVFSIGWTPCVGAFLGSALMLVAQEGESIKGILMLLSFSAGLGIPFIISALLIDRLKTSFNFIKKNYKVINIISGLLLITLGILMAFGLMGYFLSVLSF